VLLPIRLTGISLVLTGLLIIPGIVDRKMGGESPVELSAPIFGVGVVEGASLQRKARDFFHKGKRHGTPVFYGSINATKVTFFYHRNC
jgi:hypothetical protein